MRKFLAALLVLCMVASFATAFAEVRTLTAFKGDPGDQPTEDNKIYKLIEEKLGYKFNVTFLTGDLDETINIKIVGKDYPDLFDGGNSADEVINGGAVINLMDYISPEKTPNIWKHIEPQKARLIEKGEDGKEYLYIIPNTGLYEDSPQVILSVGGPAFFIQKQVLAWGGYPEINTLNEYFDLLERFIASNPTNEDGTPYIGFAILCEDWRHFCLINPVQHLMGRPNDGEVYICVEPQNYEVTGNDPSEEFKTETFIDKPYAKAYYKKLNEMYQAGLIKSSTFTASYDQYIADLSSGIVLGMFDQAWDFGSATAALQDAGKYENTYVALDIVYDPEYVGGVEIEPNYVNGPLPNVRRGFGISVTAENPEEIVQLIETLLSDEWQIILNWGIEGEDYYVDENGRLMMTEEQYAHTQDAAWKLANKADAIFSSMPKKVGYIMNDITLESGTVIKAGNCWEPGNQPEIVFGLMNDYDKNFLSAYGFQTWADFVEEPIDLAPYGEAWQIDYTPVQTAHDNFLKVQDVDLPELIMCDPAEFDAKWDAFVEEITPFCDEFAAYMQEAVLKEAHKVLDNQ